MNRDFVTMAALHVGKKLEPHIAKDVEFVQADGSELDYCRRYFPGLPVVDKRVVRYHGEWAKLIALNWN